MSTATTMRGDPRSNSRRAGPEEGLPLCPSALWTTWRAGPRCGKRVDGRTLMIGNFEPMSSRFHALWLSFGRARPFREDPAAFGGAAAGLFGCGGSPVAAGGGLQSDPAGVPLDLYRGTDFFRPGARRRGSNPTSDRQIDSWVSSSADPACEAERAKNTGLTGNWTAMLCGVAHLSHQGPPRTHSLEI